MEELQLSEFAMSVLIGGLEGVWAMLLLAAQHRTARRARVAQDQSQVSHADELHMAA